MNKFHLSYGYKLFCIFFLIIVLFSGLIIREQIIREKKLQTTSLCTDLNNYATVISKYIGNNRSDVAFIVKKMKEVKALLPSDLRYTVIDKSGKVIYDNESKLLHMGNHLNRPEIMAAFIYGNGSSIRYSATLQKEFIYVAIFDTPLYIRVSIPYEAAEQNYLSSDNVFMYLTLLFFFVVIGVLLYISSKVGKSYDQLEKEINENKKNEELLKKHKEELKKEKERIKIYFNISPNGVCQFDSNLRIIYNNASFLKYLNKVRGENKFEVDNFLETSPLFIEIFAYINNMMSNDWNNPTGYSFFERVISNNHIDLTVQVLFYSDKSFQILLNQKNTPTS